MERKSHVDVYLTCMVLLSLIWANHAKNNDLREVEQINDMKIYKKLLRTKTNILIVFSKSDLKGTELMSLFGAVATEIKGQGTLAYVNCGHGDAKKLCRKLKCDPEPLILKHYKDGDFNKDYDRKVTVQSIVNFMKDPTGDIPWEEEPTLKDIVHISDGPAFEKLLRKESGGVLVMFYAPWCGFCKRLKPTYGEAATDLRGQGILAAIDVNKPTNAIIRQHFNITGFPTLLYFEKGVFKFKYEGENTKDDIIQFMNNPSPTQKPKDLEWSLTDSQLNHLSDDTFDSFISNKPAVMVMFYAPWCGHCKVMKPEYVEAAEKLSQEEFPGALAAVDATKETVIAGRFNIRGFPTVKYFEQGEFKYDLNIRTAEKIIQFMKDPKEPPPPPPPEKPWSEMESDVVHLEEATFKSFLKRKKHVLLMFYAPWCGHCKKAKPEFIAAAAHFREDSRIAFVAVDCTVNSQLCLTNGVEGYPTIKYFSFFKTVKSYDGMRNFDGFVSFMNTPLKDEVGTDAVHTKNLLHLTASTFEEFLRSNTVVLTLFHTTYCTNCEEVKAVFSTAANNLKELNVPGILAAVDATEEKELQAKYKLNQFPSVKFFRKGILTSDYTGGHTVQDIVNFMKSSQLVKDEF